MTDSPVPDAVPERGKWARRTSRSFASGSSPKHRTRSNVMVRQLAHVRGRAIDDTIRAISIFVRRGQLLLRCGLGRQNARGRPSPRRPSPSPHASRRTVSSNHRTIEVRSCARCRAAPPDRCHLALAAAHRRTKDRSILGAVRRRGVTRSGHVDIPRLVGWRERQMIILGGDIGRRGRVVGAHSPGGTGRRARGCERVAVE